MYEGGDVLAKSPVQSSSAPRPGGAYSQGVVVGNFVFTSGVVAADPATGALVEGGIEAQTQRVLSSLAAILEAGGSSLERTVKATVHLADVGRDFTAFNSVYSRMMPDPKPVRTTVGSTLGQGVLVEIDLVAERG